MNNLDAMAEEIRQELAEKDEAREKMLPLCINNIRQGKQIPVYGDGMQIRDWLYVHDHCAAILSVFEKGKSGEVYNIGSSEDWVISIEELANIILKETGAAARATERAQLSE